VKRRLTVCSVLVTAVALIALTALPDPEGTTAPATLASRAHATAAVPATLTPSSFSVLRPDPGDGLRRSTRSRDDLRAGADGVAPAPIRITTTVTTIRLDHASQFSIASLRWNAWLRAPPLTRR
jgi:hypothetical protein